VSVFSVTHDLSEKDYLWPLDGGLVCGHLLSVFRYLIHKCLQSDNREDDTDEGRSLTTGSGSSLDFPRSLNCNPKERCSFERCRCIG
jgi:hypothetical protein